MSHRDLYERALETAPGGVHSPVRAFHGVGGTPIFFASGHGARLTDVTGHNYVDFCMSFGPLILGHRDQMVAAAVHEAVDRGWSFGACEPYSLALAEWVRARIPWLERLRFVSSGTEAVMSALRVARAATGRSKILKFEGCYHGHADGLLVRAGSGLAGPSAATSAGIPEGTLRHTVAVPLDSEAVIDEAFHMTSGDLAAVILEPVPANYGLLPQRHEWMQHLIARTRESGALVVFDEVITGFRSGPEGAAGVFGIVPDLVCYGKVIGGGFPVAAYGGRADLMNLVAPAGPVYQAGTLSANPVGMRAGLVTLEQMADREGWSVLEARTDAFVSALADRLVDVDPGLAVTRHASMFWIHRRPADGDAVRRPDRIPSEHAGWYRGFFHAALRHGVYLPPSPYEICFLSMAHDDLTLALAADGLVEAARHPEAA